MGVHMCGCVCVHMMAYFLQRGGGRCPSEWKASFGESAAVR